MPLVPRTWRIDIELNKMQSYLDHIGMSLDEEGSSAREQLRNELEGLVGEDYGEAYGHFSEEFKLDQLESEFPRYLYSGFVTTWYSFIEVSLLNLCDRLELRIEVEPWGEIPTESGILLAHRFLALDLEYRIDKKHWQILLNVNYIRNRIVHYQSRVPAVGRIPDGDNAHYGQVTVVPGAPIYVRVEQLLFNYLEHHQLLKYEGPTFVLNPSREFCEHLIDLAREVFYKLYDDLYEDN